MKIKTIIALVSAVVVVSAMSVAALWASHRPDPSPCAWLRVEVADSLDRRFVESDELRRLIAREGLLPEGQPMDEISCQAIEDCLLKHDMVRTAECFKTYQGGVRVRVTQRVPALYVMSSEGAYYVDKDRQIMPVRRTIEVDVPTSRVLWANVQPRRRTLILPSGSARTAIGIRVFSMYRWFIPST